MANNRVTSPLSITLDKRLRAAADKLLTPAGVLEVPKGSYSNLFGQLLSNWIQETAGVNVLDLLEVLETNPKFTKDQAIEAVKAKYLDL